MHKNVGGARLPNYKTLKMGKDPFSNFFLKDTKHSFEKTRGEVVFLSIKVTNKVSSRI